MRVPGAPERALEIGCGEGDGVFFLAREFPAARVRGIDPDEQAIRAAVARVGLDPEGRVAFKQGSPRRLPYPDGLFDLVVQRHGPLRPGELARVLRSGGQAILVGSWRCANWRLRMQAFDSLEPGLVDAIPFLLARRAEDG